MNSLLLHPEYARGTPLIGETCQQLLQQRSDEVAQATHGATDPNVSIVIRARNERERLEGLMQDVAAQKFAGEVQLIVVDSGSRDGTLDIVKEYGAQVVPIDQDSFSHPKALNLGFEAADHNLVLSLVGHANLTSRMALAGITRWAHMPDFGGVYGPAALPDAHASVWERLLAAGLRLDKRLEPAAPLDSLENGAMVTHRAVFVKDVWHELGKFDPKYGAGGEDKAMAQRMLQAGFQIVREPVLSIYHSHSTSLAGTVRQALEYRSLRGGEARPFDASRLTYRPNLQLDER